MPSISKGRTFQQTTLFCYLLTNYEDTSKGAVLKGLGLQLYSLGQTQSLQSKGLFETFQDKFLHRKNVGEIFFCVKLFFEVNLLTANIFVLELELYICCCCTVYIYFPFQFSKKQFYQGSRTCYCNSERRNLNCSQVNSKIDLIW